MLVRLHRVPRLSPFVCALALALLASTTHPASDLSAQVRPVYSQGIAGLLQQIQRLQTTASALHIAAHPDDEDTAFIARVARGDHARVAYLSLNRGEGGQNVIGPELLEALGVIRTEELLQARTLDGGDQFFARTYDFGFSKRVEEAAARWDAEEVLADLVRVIRLYRPLVVYNGFSGTPADGHGQHQLSGKLTPIAFERAADPAAFPSHLAEGLRPWQPKKLYVRHGFRPDPTNPPSLALPTGVLDPLIGRTYFEVAMEGRSQHKSQQMGVPELLGPQTSGLRLVESLVAAPAQERGVFDGIDTTLAGLPKLAGLPDGALTAEMQAVQQAVTRAIADFDPLAPAAAVAPLARGLRALRDARAALARLQAPEGARAEADFLLAVKEQQFQQALVRAAEVTVDPLADAETVAQGESIGVAVRVFLGQKEMVSISTVGLSAPEGWRVEPGELRESTDPRPFARFRTEAADKVDTYRMDVPADAPCSQPYWLRLPRKGDQFQWDPKGPKSVPFEPPLLTARVEMAVGGMPIVVTRPVQYRLVDQVRGELRRDVNVVPAVSLTLGSTLEIVPLASVSRSRRVAVRVQNNAGRQTSGTLRLTLPQEWRSQPAEAPFTLARKGERTAVEFLVTPPATTVAGTYRIRAEASVGGSRYDLGARTVSYPHIQTHRMYVPAEAQVRVLDLKAAQVRVGYIMGSGDQVPDAIRRMGLDVAMLGEDDLASGDLSRFDVIVVGVRASEARPDFVASHARLLSYVREGGTMIVQYQQTDYAMRGLMPFPAEIGPRVVDERAPVTILAPEHPAFTTPNRIGEADFEDWVQERFLYGLSTFDPQYAPMLESADPGEAPQRGGQVIARLGKGTYVYTAYAWFRQLPAGVPGAYRLFANLLGLATAGREE